MKMMERVLRDCSLSEVVGEGEGVFARGGFCQDADVRPLHLG